MEKKEVVFGRTEDGGYYLVGMKKARREVFGLDTYGHSSVFAETLEQLKKKKISVGYTETLNDMDTPIDLKKYRKRLRKDRKLFDKNRKIYLGTTSHIHYCSNL